MLRMSILMSTPCSRRRAFTRTPWQNFSRDKVGIEREVKYQVLDQALFRRLNAMDHIGNFALEHAGTVDILTIYLDTPELSPVSYTHLRAHETRHDLVCRLLLEKKKTK